MGQRVNVTTAARLTGRSERTIRDWLAEDPCPLSVEPGPWRGGRKGEPGRTRWLDVDELRRVHEARGGRDWHMEYLPVADLDALRAEVQALRTEVASLRARLEGASVARYTPKPPVGLLSELQGHSGDWTPPARSARLPVVTRPIGSTDTLPAHLVSWRAFAKVHAIPITTVAKAIETHRLPVVSGKWKQGRNYVEGALDAEGRRAFVRQWGHRPDFARCSECPHEVEAPAREPSPTLKRVPASVDAGVSS